MEGFTLSLASYGCMLSEGREAEDLLSVRDTIQEEKAGLRQYIKKMAPTDDQLCECLRQLKPSMEEEPGGGYHRWINPCMACIAGKFKRLLTLEKHTDSCKNLDRQIAQRH